MDDPGSPWKPVPASSQPADAEPTGEEPAAVDELPEVDPMFDVPEPVVIHSSELGQAEDPEDTEPAVAEADVPQVAPEPDVEPVEPEAAPQPEPLPATQTFAQFAPVAAAAWPLRLVATVPGAQPPRAILGLPGGTEVVVTPGTMLPDAGVVVMAIGSDSVDLAEVRPAGDHAVVQGRTLQAQRSQRIEIGAAQ